MLHTIKHRKLEYLTADALEGSIHCFSTRYGGVSEGYLSSLNLGTHRGDKPENVYENYRILGSAVGFRPEDTVFTKQLHTDIVRRVGRADRGAGLLREQTEVCDAQITDEPGVALVAFTADCTPILLFDPVRKAIADIVSQPLSKTSNADMKALRLNMQDMRGQKRVLDQRKAQVESWYD